VSLAFAIASVHAGNCDYAQLKACFNFGSLISGEGVKWPTSDGEVQSMCGRAKDGFECVKKFNADCVKESDRLFLKGVGDKITALFKEVCESPAGRSGFLKRVSSCYGKPEVAKGFRDAHVRFVGMVEHIGANVAKGERRAAVCCSTLSFRDGVRKMTAANCDADTQEYIRSKVESMGEKMRLLCQMEEGTPYETCAAKLGEGVRGALAGFINAPTPPTTKYPVALPTFFQMWMERN
jgi:hypothetical protein